MAIEYPEEYAARLESITIRERERRIGRTEEKEIRARERLGKAQVSAKQKIALKRIKLGAIGTKKILKRLETFKIAPQLSQEQNFLQEMFGGRDSFWGTGTCLPVLNHSLNSGHGLINSGDEENETASLFGMRRRRLI